MSVHLHRSAARLTGRQDRYLVERVRLLYAQANIGILGSLFCALIVYFTLLPLGDGIALSVWIAAVLLVTLSRVWLVQCFRRSAKQASAVRAWRRHFVLLTACSGLAYGYVGLFLAADRPESIRLLIYLVLVSLTAGSVATYSAVLPVFLAFTLPVLASMFLHFALMAEQPINLVYAAGCLMFLLMLAANAWMQNRSIDRSLRIKFENADLIGILEEAKGEAETLNEGLKAEIAERRRVEADLARSIALYQATMDAVEEGILVLDRNQQVLAVNQRFKDLWGLEDEDIAAGGGPHAALAKAVEQTVDPSSMVAEHADPDPDDPRPRRGLIDLKDGRVFERYSVPYRLDGTVIGRVWTVREVTDRIAAERELLQAKEAAESASRAKSEFLAHISHELRTPLNAVIGFSDIFRREMFGTLGSPRYHAYATDIYDSATLLLSLINDILDLSKIEAGRTELADEKISVPHLVATVVRLIRSRATDAGIAIEERIPHHLPALRGDERACKQMLTNLLTNAVKFTGANGRVWVSAELIEGGGLALTVSDTGIGMAAEDLPRALEPFRQIDSPMTRRHEGTGLGLPLVKALIEAHGGRLELESEPGRGTEARLVFPAERLAQLIPTSIRMRG